MAVLWQKTVDGRNYQVRSAGQTRRLYTDGVFHSQFNPANPISGSVWDLLMIPAFFYPPGRLRRVLVLGVGGGAVIQLLRRFVEPQAIVGIELNPVHLYVARRFFGMQRENVQLVEGDGIEWARNYNGPGFDLIIEDLFGEQDGEPVRAVSADGEWFRTLLAHLNSDGALVLNFTAVSDLRDCAFFTDPPTGKQFQCAFQLTTPLYENAVGAFLRKPATTRELRQRLIETPGLNPTLRTSRLDYRIRRFDSRA
jgi:spermidine synthase